MEEEQVYFGVQPCVATVRKPCSELVPHVCKTVCSSSLILCALRPILVQKCNQCKAAIARMGSVPSLRSVYPRTLPAVPHDQRLCFVRRGATVCADPRPPLGCAKAKFAIGCVLVLAEPSCGLHCSLLLFQAPDTNARPRNHQNQGARFLHSISCQGCIATSHPCLLFTPHAGTVPEVGSTVPNICA
jgi:hypothetical protein